MDSNLLEKLNTQQLEAVTHENGPLMIIAGAGTGKTTVITQRVAWLIEQGKAKPDEILALTFTEKAANEMEERVDQLLPIGYVEMWISTFHSFCERILRQHALDIGIAHEFTLLNEVDTFLLVNKNFERFDLNYYAPKSNPTRFIKALLQHFSRIKDEMVTPEQYLKFAEDLKMNTDMVEGSGSEDQSEEMVEIARIGEIANAYHTYQQILLENNAMDFADLIAYTLELFRSRPKILKKYQDQFRYILVDEFQDTNSIQYELVKLLIKEPFNITVVGDDDQSIYRFRGASISNIMNFTKDFPNSKQIVLNQNYRSAKRILDHSYQMIQNNNPNRLEHQEQIDKTLLPNLEPEGKVEHIECRNLEDEIHEVIKRIIELQKQTQCSWSDFAILVRANDHANPFIELMNQIRLPYRFVALSGLYTKPIVLDALAHMRVIDQHFESPSMYRILSHPELGINEDDIAKLTLYSRKKGVSLIESMQIASDVSQKGKARISEILSELSNLESLAKRKPTSELFVEIIKTTGLIGTVQKLEEQNQIEQNRYLQQFFERIKRFEYSNDDKSLHNFLLEFEHERSSGEFGALSNDAESGPDVINIMTIHASKGLEFKYVFLVNTIEQRFPSQTRRDPIEIPPDLIKLKIENGRDAHIEEERRLFYVAMTRAKEHLYLLSSENYGGKKIRKVSRFVKELELDSKKSKNESTLENPKIKSRKSELRYELPSNISFTQIAAFSNCPKQYKYAHILKVPIFGRYQMSFGKTMHNTLDEFMNEYSNIKNKIQDSLFENQNTKLAVPPKSRLLEIYKQKWIDEWYPNKKIKDEYFEKGRQSLIEYHKSLICSTPEVAFLEKDFSLKISGISIKGRIDRIDKIENGYEIIDYKTGKPKNKLDWQDRKQLILYTLACEQCFDPPLKILKLTYQYLEDNSSVSFEPNQKEKEKLENQIIDIVNQIRMSDHSAKSGFHCQFCDFKDICEQSQA